MVGFWERLKAPTLRPIGCWASAVPDGVGLRWERDRQCKLAFGVIQMKQEEGQGRES